jgi:hypothetical protein
MVPGISLEPALFRVSQRKNAGAVLKVQLRRVGDGTRFHESICRHLAGRNGATSVRPFWKGITVEAEELMMLFEFNQFRAGLPPNVPFDQCLRDAPCWDQQALLQSEKWGQNVLWS